MILVLQKNTPEPAIRQLLAQLALQNVKGGCVAGETSILLPLVGETWRLDPAALQALPYVQEARRLTPAYHLAARSTHPENTVVPVGDVRVGADFCLIAGPCAVESAYQIQTVAAAVKAAGAVMLRGGAFKPRTSPYTFQGLGEQGTALLVQAGRDTGLPTVTEITDPAQLDTLADVDVLQVGARNMQNFALLKALGRTRKPILLKRGTSATVEELLEAVKTKRYPAARLRRLVLAAWLELPKAPETVPYARVLAANETGRALLRQMRKAGAPVLTKAADVAALGSAAAELFRREAAYTDLYTLTYDDLTQSHPGSDWRLTPIMR